MRYRVIRDFGIDLAGRHFVHGEEFESIEVKADELAAAEKAASVEKLAAAKAKPAEKEG